jgi:hypothetical protein
MVKSKERLQHYFYSCDANLPLPCLLHTYTWFHFSWFRSLPLAAPGLLAPAGVSMQPASE